MFRRELLTVVVARHRGLDARAVFCRVGQLSPAMGPPTADRPHRAASEATFLAQGGLPRCYCAVVTVEDPFRWGSSQASSANSSSVTAAKDWNFFYLLWAAERHRDSRSPVVLEIGVQRGPMRRASPGTMSGCPAFAG
jgi:hypothetical protein